jgi:hypothetical protein
MRVTGSFGEDADHDQEQGNLARSRSKLLWGRTLPEVLEAEMTEALDAEKGWTGGGSAELPVEPLRPDIDHAGRPAEIARPAGPNRAVLDRAFLKVIRAQSARWWRRWRNVRAG